MIKIQIKEYDLVFLIGSITYHDSKLSTVYPPGTTATVVDLNNQHVMLEMPDNNVVYCTIDQIEFYYR